MCLIKSCTCLHMAWGRFQAWQGISHIGYKEANIWNKFRRAFRAFNGGWQILLTEKYVLSFTLIDIGGGTDQTTLGYFLLVGSWLTVPSRGGCLLCSGTGSRATIVQLKFSPSLQFYPVSFLQRPRFLTTDTENPWAVPTPRGRLTGARLPPPAETAPPLPSPL